MSLIETRDSVEIKPLALFTAGTAAGVSSESCAEPEYLRPCETQFFVFFSSSLQTRLPSLLWFAPLCVLQSLICGSCVILFDFCNVSPPYHEAPCCTSNFPKHCNKLSHVSWLLKLTVKRCRMQIEFEVLLVSLSK